MAESVTETGGFTQDLFSPLQFCEVVEEGQQQRQQHLNQQQSHQQHLQQMHQHQAHLSQQQITTLQTAQPAHHHHQQQQNNQQPQLQNPTQLQQQPPPPPPPPPQSQQQSVKQETSQQAVQSQLLNSPDTKTQSLMNGVSSMEIFLAAPNPLHLQTVSSPLVAIHQQHLPQPMYQVHLSRQQQTIDLTRHTHQTLQQLQLGGLHLQGQSHAPNIQISQQNHRSQEAQPPPISMGVGAIVNVGSTESFALPVNSTTTSTKPPSTNAVATQTTPTDGSHHEDDEPEIIFTSVPNVTSESTTVTLSINPSSDTGSLSGTPKMSNGSANIVSDGNTETKPVPVKRTWRRPWKKKKEREKRQPVKKVRRMKRRRVVIPKKNVVHIDPRHGPPIDTSCTVVERESEETINQLKQKRQRIKLNRNSGREYVNRLGKVVRARKIGSPCNCPLKCWDRMGSKILDIFNNFWDLCDFNLQNSYLFTCLKLCDVKRRYTKKPAEESRRQNTFEYFVRISGKHLRVCKKAFMSSHGLTSDKRLRTLFSQMKDGALIPEPDRRGKHLRPTKGPGSNGHGVLTHSALTTTAPSHTNHNNNNNNFAGSQTKSSGKTKGGNRGSTKKKPPSATHRNMDTTKQAMYTPPAHAVAHLHPHCTPPPPAHGTPMQEPPHAYIPNGEIYLPGHYLEPPQAMAPPHMNQIPSCQKMIEPPAYFMAGMRENTFHQ